CRPSPPLTLMERCRREVRPAFRSSGRRRWERGRCSPERDWRWPDRWLPASRLQGGLPADGFGSHFSQGTLGYLGVTCGTAFLVQCNSTAKQYVAYNGLIAKLSRLFMHKTIDTYGFSEAIVTILPHPA